MGLYRSACIIPPEIAAWGSGIPQLLYRDLCCAGILMIRAVLAE
jgi:hypothetical protein